MTMLASFKLAKRVLFESDKRLLWKLAYNMGLKGALSVHKHKRRMKRGQFFPPFLYVSIINSCNLRCQGFWVDVSMKQQTISPMRFTSSFASRGRWATSSSASSAASRSCTRTCSICSPSIRCYFQVFTNGHFITPERRMWQLGNVTPLISVEGRRLSRTSAAAAPTCSRRRCKDFYNALDAGVFTALHELAHEHRRHASGTMDRHADRDGRALYLVSRLPADGPASEPGPVLDARASFRARSSSSRCAKSRSSSSTPTTTATASALCPAANGISHHINPWGGIEPCPIVQFSTESDPLTKEDPRPLKEKFLSSAFLADFRKLAAETTRGCIVLERRPPEEAGGAHGAKDATARQTALAELEAMTPRTSQYNPANEIPEKNVFYRLAKRLFFNDFGVYTGHDARHAQVSAPAVLGK